MSESYEKAFQYFTDFLKWLAPDARIQRLPDFTFRIVVGDELTDVHFDRSEMDDFEIALEKYQNTNYLHTLENRIRFRFFVAWGSKGLFPYLQISSELLKEKGEWLKNLITDLTFDTGFCKVLYQGLTLLSASIEKTLASAPGLNLPEVEAERHTVNNLKSFYEKNGHLNIPGAEIESLSYLKAAAVCVIMEKEKARKVAEIPRLIKAIDGDIYAIVSKIRDDPFRDIKLPEAIHDYAIQQDATERLHTYDHPSNPQSTADAPAGKMESVPHTTTAPAAVEQEPHDEKIGKNEKTWDDAMLLALLNESNQHGITQEHLAKKHGVSRQRIGFLIKTAKKKHSVRNPSAWSGLATTSKTTKNTRY
jgi:hypothetical protein